MSKSVEIPITYAASNAIQILNQAGTCFTKCDFSGIRVPDANLYKAFFNEANLSQSDLTGCILTSSFLQSCNLEKATMKNVEFGVFPDLKCEAIVNSVCMSKTGSLLACGPGNDGEKGQVQIWDYLMCVRKAVIDAHD